MHKYGNCSFCEGQVKNNKIELEYKHKGKLYFFKNMKSILVQK